jgi:hypothetical protein
MLCAGGGDTTITSNAALEPLSPQLANGGAIFKVTLSVTSSRSPLGCGHFSKSQRMKESKERKDFSVWRHLHEVQNCKLQLNKHSNPNDITLVHEHMRLLWQPSR